MTPWVLLASAQIPGDGEELRLYQRGSEFSIRVGQVELMDSRVHGSEEALASVACERLRGRGRVRVLVGGLGMGFTLAEVLRGVGPESQVVVAELVPEVVAWNRGPLAALAGRPLDDPRVIVRESDVAKVIRAEVNAYDAIVLDVDTAPRALTSKKNAWLYGADGLKAAFAALRPEGILAVWSSVADEAFTRRLQQAGFETSEVKVRGHGAGGPRYLVWLGVR